MTRHPRRLAPVCERLFYSVQRRRGVKLTAGQLLELTDALPAILERGEWESKHWGQPYEGEPG